MDKETLHEAANRMYGPNLNCQGEDSEYFERAAFIAGAGWQARRSYSEEEVLDILFKHTEYFAGFGERVSLTEWFEQFKKK